MNINFDTNQASPKLVIKKEKKLSEVDTRNIEMAKEKRLRQNQKRLLNVRSGGFCKE